MPCSPENAADAGAIVKEFMMIKKLIAVIMCTAVLGLSACSSAADIKGSKINDDKLTVVCSTFSGFDWTREIMGSHVQDAELIYLLENGADLHNYQPSAADIVKISTCDVFIYVGGESDGWAEDAVKEAANKDMQVVKLIDTEGLTAKEEEVKEGMEAEEEEEDEGEGEPEYDEHVWLSVKNAEILCDSITSKLCLADPDNSDDYKANCDAYKTKLAALDKKYEQMSKETSEKTLIFGDRFPFRYLCDDYGIDYYAAFVGCSAETEASFETVAFLAKKADELGADTIFTLENSDGRIAQSIKQNTKTKDQQIAVLDSIQSVSKTQMDAGETYISIMEKNCETIRNAIK